MWARIERDRVVNASKFESFSQTFLDRIIEASERPQSLIFHVKTGFSSVTFRTGAVCELADAIERLERKSVFIAATRGGWARYRSFVEANGVDVCGVFDRAEPHCPEHVVEVMREAFKEAGARCVLAIGGGSTLGLGKILSAEEGAGFVAMPTTYSGSEMTPIYGRKIGFEKRTKKDPACIPGEVIYDPVLSQSLPIEETVQSGMNSLAHAVEALYAENADQFTEKAASVAIGAHIIGLTKCALAPGHLGGRTHAALGGFLGGMLVQRHGIALHHQLCHVLGGLFDLPHGVSNSAVLSHAFAYNAPAAPDAANIIADRFSHQNAALALYEFTNQIGRLCR